jgi:hypothetical protein
MPVATGGGTSIAGARCAVHPDLAAHAVCARCGNYMCATCSEQGSSKLCTDCRARPDTTDFPFSRNHYSLEGLIDYTLKRWKAHWLTLSVAALIFLGIIYAFTFLAAGGAGFLSALRTNPGEERAIPAMSTLSILVQFLQLFVQLWLQLGLFALLIDAVQGREPKIATLFSRASRMPAALGQMLLIYSGMIVLLLPFAVLFFVHDQATQLKIAAGLVLLELIPFAYLGIGLMFAQIELVYNRDAGALSGIRTSFELVRGQRIRVLGMMFVFGLIAIAGVLACCVGAIPTMTIAGMLSCALFLALRTPGKA